MKKTHEEHSVTTEEEGEKFTPDIAKAVKLEVDFNNLEGKVLDQYNELFSRAIVFTIEEIDKATIVDKKVIEEEVVKDTNYFIVAKFNSLEQKQEKIIHAQKKHMKRLQ